MLKKALRLLDGLALRNPWTQNFGIARTLVALSGLGTLALSAPSDLFRATDAGSGFFCGSVAKFSFWCVVGEANVDWARAGAILVLFVAASGWRPRITALPLWWILFSNQASINTIDGGDQVAANVALLMVPIALTDSRRWHWQAMSANQAPMQRVLANVGVLTVLGQMCFIYLNACLTKLAVPEWTDGTALYYWLRNPMFGPPGPFGDFLRELTTHELAVAAGTWGTLWLEFFLGVGFLLPRRSRPYLLLPVLIFHAMIASMMGLWSFAFAMWSGALLAYWPDGDALNVAWAWIKLARARFRSRNTALGRTREQAGQLPLR